jgi:hypothetical protein
MSAPCKYSQPQPSRVGGALVLHPFGGGGEAGTASKIDQRAHEGAVVLGADEVFHEGAVDLDHVDAELAQVAERGVAGAEIVDGDAAAEIFDAREAARLVTSSMAALSVISTIRRSAAGCRSPPPSHR